MHTAVMHCSAAPTGLILGLHARNAVLQLQLQLLLQCSATCSFCCPGLEESRGEFLPGCFKEVHSKGSGFFDESSSL